MKSSFVIDRSAEANAALPFEAADETNNNEDTNSEIVARISRLITRNLFIVLDLIREYAEGKPPRSINDASKLNFQRRDCNTELERPPTYNQACFTQFSSDKVAARRRRIDQKVSQFQSGWQRRTGAECAALQSGDGVAEFQAGL